MFEPDRGLSGRYVDWIEQFDRRHTQNWAKLFKKDVEAAMWEATVWGLLTDCGVTVEPNADLHGARKAPDFVCTKDGEKFYVEATCIQIATATAQTHLSHPPQGRAQNYSNLNRAIFSECVNKVDQCANVDAPCVLAIGTFHFQASVLCIKKVHLQMLLTGQSLLSWDLDLESGQSVGEPYNSTELRFAGFLRPRTAMIEPARTPISAIVVGGFGCQPPHVFGLLHPNPERHFDATILDRIEFCGLRDGYDSGILTPEWINNRELD